MSKYAQIMETIERGRSGEIAALVQQALDEGSSAAEILSQGMLAAMDVVGDRFQRSEIYVPEILMAARTMNTGMEILKPLLAEAGVKPIGKAILGTVKGDLHDIGKNLVKIMLEGKGIEVIDLGVDVPAEKFVDAAEKGDAAIIACSALLTTTMGEMEKVVKALEERGLRDKIKVMVGGAPITQEYCNLIKADYYTADAASAAEVAVEILGGK